MLKAIGCCANKGKPSAAGPPTITDLGPTPAPSENPPIIQEPLDGPDENDEKADSDYMEPRVSMMPNGIRNRINPCPMNMAHVIADLKKKPFLQKDEGYVGFEKRNGNQQVVGIKGHHGDSDDDSQEYMNMYGNLGITGNHKEGHSNKAFTPDSDDEAQRDYVNTAEFTSGVLPKTQTDDVTKPQKYENIESGLTVDVEGMEGQGILRKKPQNRNATNPMNTVLKEMEQKQKMDGHKPGHAVACSKGVANSNTKTKKEVHESSDDDNDDNSQHSYENTDSWTDGVLPPNIVVPKHEEQPKRPRPPAVKPKPNRPKDKDRASNPAQTNRKKYENTSVGKDSIESRKLFEADRRSDRHHIAEVHRPHKPRIEPEDNENSESNQAILRHNQNETESENKGQNKAPVESIGTMEDVKPPNFVCPNPGQVHEYVNDPRLKNTGKVMDKHNTEAKGDKQSVKPPIFICDNSKQEPQIQSYVNVPDSKPPGLKNKGDVTLPVNLSDDNSSAEYIPDSDSDSEVIYDDDVVLPVIRLQEEEEDDIYDDENILVVSGIKADNRQFRGNQRPTSILPSLSVRAKGAGDKQTSGQVANIPAGQQQNTQQIEEQDIYEDTVGVCEGIQGRRGMQTGIGFHHPFLHAKDEEDEIDQRESVGPVLPGRMRPQPGSSIGTGKREVNNNEDIAEDMYESVEVPSKGVQSTKNKTPTFNKDVENMVKSESKFLKFFKGKKTDKTADREDVKTNEPVTGVQGVDGKVNCDKRPPMPLPKSGSKHPSVTQSTPDVRGDDVRDMSNFIKTHGINTAQRVKQIAIKSELDSKLQELKTQKDF